MLQNLTASYVRYLVKDLYPYVSARDGFNVFETEIRTLNYIDMEYKGDIFDRINFNKIFNSNRVKGIIGNSTKEFIPFRIVYTY